MTAEQLMRSRYSAFALGDTAYLERSWHPDTRPRPDPPRPGPHAGPASSAWPPPRGGMLDQEGTVEFEAHHRDADGDHVLHEVSTFTRVDGAWVYVGRLD